MTEADRDRKLADHGPTRLGGDFHCQQNIMAASAGIESDVVVYV